MQRRTGLNLLVLAGTRVLTPFLLGGCLASLDFSGISDGRSEDPLPPAMAYWPLDEGSGLSAADTVGGHDGTIISINGSPHFTTTDGHRGGALLFANDEGALTIPSLSNAAFPRRGSLAIWARADKLPTDRRLIFAARLSIRPSALELSLENDRFIWSSHGDDTASFIDGVVPSEWFLVVAMWDIIASQRSLYVREDGGRSSLVESSLATVDADLTDVTFEVEHPSGAIDEMRLFDHILTRGELDAIF